MKKFIYGMEHTISFGKYKGMSISELCAKDPDYILWALREVSGFFVAEDVYKLCQENLR